MSDAGLVHIVDDDPGVRLALSSLVRSVGYSARLYESAAEFPFRSRSAGRASNSP